MKELLEKLAAGESTVDDVLKAIDDANAERVPRSRLNDKIEEIKDLEKQLADRDSQLEGLKGTAKDHETLQAEIERLQSENKTAAEQYQAELQQKTLELKLDNELLGAKARNPRAVKALLDMDVIKMDGEQIIGLSEQLNRLIESDAYLFNGDGQQKQQNYNPGGGRGNEKKEADPYAAGAERAKQRHSKGDDK